MIKIILVIATALNLFGSIEISQNMKALYKNVQLNEEQKKFIFDNEERAKQIIKSKLIEETKSIKNLNGKNVVAFKINKNGEIKNINILQENGNETIDRAVINAVKKAAINFPRPKEETEMRYIISFGNDNKIKTYQNNSGNSSEPYYQNIERGTTKFEYSRKEYTRVFQTSKDGFINMYQEPMGCAKNVTILDNYGKKIAEASSMLFSKINVEAGKGKYKILVFTKQDCNINLQYP